MTAGLQVIPPSARLLHTLAMHHVCIRSSWAAGHKKNSPPEVGASYIAYAAQPSGTRLHAPLFLLLLAVIITFATAANGKNYGY